MDTAHVIPDPTTAPQGGRWIGYPRTVTRLVVGTNINEATLLTTDYLNHFNEAAMLIELVPTMPDCMEDLKDWAPLSYIEHFRRSGLSDGPLAILAYENCRPEHRVPFDQTVASINAVILRAIAALDDGVTAGATESALQAIAGQTARALEGLMGAANALIHGNVAISDQSTVDALIGNSPGPAGNGAAPVVVDAPSPAEQGHDGAEDAVCDQAAIDALFGD